MMKKFLLALALILAPSLAAAQCTGAVANNTVCGNATGSNNTMRATPSVSFPANITIGTSTITGGTSFGVLFNNAGVVGNTAAGTAGYALTGNGASAPTFQGFLQSGTGAITRTWQAKAADFVSVTDFGTDTAAIQAAVNTTKTVYFPCGNYTWSSTITMSVATSLIGAGQDCVNINLSALPTTSNALQITPTSVRAGMEIAGFNFYFVTASVPAGQDLINITTSGSTNYISKLSIHDTTVSGTAGGVGSGIGRNALRIDNAGAHIGGGVTHSSFENNNWLSTQETVYLVQAGDDLKFTKNVMTSTASRCYYVDLIAGAGHFVSAFDVLACKEGSHLIESGAAFQVLNNLIEQTGTNTTGAVINARGGVSKLDGGLISGNQIQEPGSLGNPIPINVDNADGVIVTSNPLIRRNAGGTHINVTVNATTTVVDLNNRCYVSSAASVCSIAGTPSAFSPTATTRGTTTTFLAGDATGAPGVYSTIPAASLTPIAANTALINATGSSAAPTAIALPSCSTTQSGLNYTTSGGASAVTCRTFGSTVTANLGTSGATVPLLNGANTWSTTQTFTVAPVFTDASGSRTALGLGTAATQATGTSGATLPFLNGTNTWSGVNTFSGGTASTATTNGQIVVTGGAGFSGAINVGAASTFGSTTNTSGAYVAARRTGASFEFGVNTTGYTSTIGTDGNGTPYYAFAARASGTGANFTTENVTPGGAMLGDGAGGITYVTIPQNSTNVAPTQIASLTSAGKLTAITLNATTAYQANGVAGLTIVKTVRAGGGAADCTLTYTMGLLTASTC